MLTFCQQKVVAVRICEREQNGTNMKILVVTHRTLEWRTALGIRRSKQEQRKIAFVERAHTHTHTHVRMCGTHTFICFGSDGIRKKYKFLLFCFLLSFPLISYAPFACHDEYDDICRTHTHHRQR